MEEGGKDGLGWGVIGYRKDVMIGGKIKKDRRKYRREGKREREKVKMV